MIQNKKQEKENKQTFLKRKLSIFSLYIQKEPLYPEDSGFCEICQNGTPRLFHANFSHKEKIFNLRVCENCCNESGIKIKSAKRIYMDLSRSIRNTINDNDLIIVVCDFCKETRLGKATKHFSMCKSCAVYHKGGY